MTPQSLLEPLPTLAQHQPQSLDTAALHILCENCQRICAASARPATSANATTNGDEEKLGLRLFPHCKNLRELKKSGETGCHLCSLAYAGRIETEEENSSETTGGDGALEAAIEGDPPSAVVFRTRASVVARLSVLQVAGM